MNLPNKITLARIALIPVFVLVYYLTVIAHNLAFAAIVFALAAFTDFLDGHIARKYNMVTDMGKFLDPIADKVLVLTAFLLMLTPVCGGVLEAVSGGIGVIIILARELIISSFRMVAATKNVVIAADKLGKFKTVTQDASILILLFARAFSDYKIFASAPNGFFDVLYCIGYAVFALCVVLTVLSGVSYINKNKKVLQG